MNILLMNYMLGGTTGSETWTAAMQKELESFGHSVTASIDANLLPDIFDGAIINHNICLRSTKHLTCKKIFTSHGVIPDLEQPVWGADVYVAVSEEVQRNLKDKGFDSIVIRNGIDLDVYRPTKPVNSTLKKVLFSSNYTGGKEKIIRQACDLLGVSFTRIGGKNKVTNVPEVLNEHDFVIGLGRTALEAMACNRNVIIYDYNGGDGFVTPDNIYTYCEANCSGRTNHIYYTPESLAQEMQKYNPDLNLRSYIEEHNNLKKIVQQYLSML